MKFDDPRFKRSREIPPEAIGGGVLDRFIHDNFHKPCYRARDFQSAHFVMMDYDKRWRTVVIERMPKNLWQKNQENKWPAKGY